MLTFSEFKNILTLICSEDKACKILGFSLWKSIGGKRMFQLIKIDAFYEINEYYGIDGHLNFFTYEQLYEKYLLCDYLRGI